MTREAYEANHRVWEERARFHLETPMYRGYLERLRAGGDTLLPFDDAVLGDLRGRRVLHLQCHVGPDTLSLARRGAEVVGVDFSGEAVEQATKLAREFALADRVRFLRSDIYALPDVLEGEFDLVYTSYGALCWLHDMGAWAKVAARYVRPSGRLIAIDSHPMGDSIDDEFKGGEQPRLQYRYFAQPEPLRFEDGVNYADPDRKSEHSVSYAWIHSLQDILQSVLDAGLKLTQFREHPECYWRRFPNMTLGEDGLYRLPDELHGRWPLTFSLEARRP